MISQQSRRLERLDKGCNTGKPDSGEFCRLEEVVAVEVDHVSAQAVGGSILRDPPAELWRFVGTLLGCFARSFSVVFENQLARESGGWYLLRSVGEFLELFESRVCANARDVECVLFSCGCYGGGWCKAVGNISDGEL